MVMAVCRPGLGGPGVQLLAERCHGGHWRDGLRFIGLLLSGGGNSADGADRHGAVPLNGDGADRRSIGHIRQNLTNGESDGLGTPIGLALPLTLGLG